MLPEFSESPPVGENVGHERQPRSRAKGSTCLLHLTSWKTGSLALFSRLVKCVIRMLSLSVNLLPAAKRGVHCPEASAGSLCRCLAATSRQLSLIFFHPGETLTAKRDRWPRHRRDASTKNPKAFRRTPHREENHTFPT